MASNSSSRSVSLIKSGVTGIMRSRKVGYLKAKAIQAIAREDASAVDAAEVSRMLDVLSRFEARYPGVLRKALAGAGYGNGRAVGISAGAVWHMVRKFETFRERTGTTTERGIYRIETRASERFSGLAPSKAGRPKS